MGNSRNYVLEHQTEKAVEMTGVNKGGSNVRITHVRESKRHWHGATLGCGSFLGGPGEASFMNPRRFHKCKEYEGYLEGARL